MNKDQSNPPKRRPSRNWSQYNEALVQQGASALLMLNTSLFPGSGLTLPEFEYKTKKLGDKLYIFDVIRKKYVRLTPEEWVRQHIANYLITSLAYPVALMAVEKSQQTFGTQPQRADLIVYSKDLTPWMIIECKAPTQPISQETLAQVVRYNEKKAPFLVLTNGVKHFCCALNKQKTAYKVLNYIPSAYEMG